MKVLSDKVLPLWNETVRMKVCFPGKGVTPVNLKNHKNVIFSIIYSYTIDNTLIL